MERELAGSGVAGEGAVRCQAHTAPAPLAGVRIYRSKARERGGEGGTCTSTSPDGPRCVCTSGGAGALLFFLFWPFFPDPSILCRCIFFQRYPNFSALRPRAWYGMVWHGMVYGWGLEPEPRGLPKQTPELQIHICEPHSLSLSLSCVLYIFCISGVSKKQTDDWAWSGSGSGSPRCSPVCQHIFPLLISIAGAFAGCTMLYVVRISNQRD